MQNPTLIATPFAENGDKNIIPDSVPAEPQNATMQAGFPPITQQKISQGGIPPERNDFNGILNALSQHTVFLNKGGRYGFDAEFANKIGGYEKGACLTLNDGTQVVSNIDANTNDPDVNMTGWVLPPIKINASSVLDESGLTQQEWNNGVDSVSDLALIKTPKDGNRAYVKSYHKGLNKGGGVFIYDSTQAAINNGGTIINGWVLQKEVITVWDFGYHTTDKTLSTNAIKNAFASELPLSLKAELLSSHNRTQVACPANKIVIGQGIGVSIISGLTVVTGGSTYIFKDFEIINAEGNLNYGIVVNKYDYVLIDGFKAENTYDAVSIWKANSETSQAIVQNSIAVKAGRIGFTADLGAKNVVFKNLKVYDSRQGYHGELVAGVYLDNCLAIRCGNDAPVPRPPDQPAIYAGGFRFHTFKDVTMLNCRNIDKAGRSIDWLGGGGDSLLLDNCKGINLTTDDVAPSDPVTSYTYKDISVLNSPDCSFTNQLSKSIISGSVILENIQLGGNFDFLGSLNTISKFSMRNVSCKRAQAATITSDAVLVLDNLSTSSSYSCIFTGFSFHDIGDISYNREVGDDSQYPQLGYRFIAKNAKTFFLKSFTSIGRGGGSQISLEDIDSVKFKGGMIGKVASIGSIDAFSGVNFNALNITYVRKGVAAANAVGVDDTAVKLNALIASLRNAGYIN